MCWSFWGATCYHVQPTSGRLGRVKLKVLSAKSSIAFVSSSLAAAPQLVTVEKGVYAARIIVIFKPIIRVTFITCCLVIVLLLGNSNAARPARGLEGFCVRFVEAMCSGRISLSSTLVEASCSGRISLSSVCLAFFHPFRCLCVVVVVQSSLHHASMLLNIWTILFVRVTLVMHQIPMCQ